MSGFGRAFRSIRKREPFASPPLPELAERKFDALIAAALAKCVEFNIAVNRARKHDDEDFAFVSTLRGVSEDLITLSYMSMMPPARRQELTDLLINRTLADGLDVQEAFFAANNPYQPVVGQRDHPMLGTRDASSALPSRSRVARVALKEFWRSIGSTRPGGPSVKEMATAVGLGFTYDYIYFAASNFVHFNPQALLRMGWGDSKGPFRFSVRNMNGYYKSLASFYGAILFIGFHSAFRSPHLSLGTDKDVERLIDLIESIHRWPEVITFEEMNQRPPLYLLTYALRRAAPDGSPGGILGEVRGLGARLLSTC